MDMSPVERRFIAPRVLPKEVAEDEDTWGEEKSRPIQKQQLFVGGDEREKEAKSVLYPELQTNIGE